MNTETRPVKQVLAAIDALDLDCIKLKLMDHKEGHGWSREYADAMEIAYRRFLALMAKFPEETIAPTKDIDKFWHGHILDTMKYAEDCETVFGYFLHHFPYFGMRGEEDANNLQAAADKLRVLYEREFGEALRQGPAFCGASLEKAFCGASADKAFCGAAVAAAFCGAAKAFCGAAKPAAAFCGAAKPKQDGLNAKLRPTLPAAA
jgi:Glycine-rich domain-containing protein-like